MLGRVSRRRWVLLPVLLLLGCSADPAAPVARIAQGVPDGAPALLVDVLLAGLDHPWDVARAPDGTLLLDQRGGGFTAVRPDGTVQPVAADLTDLFVRGDTGLMGLALDRDFATNRRFYSCQAVQEPTGPEVQVIAWTVDEGWTSATRVADPLLGGIPVDAETGRDGACSLQLDGGGELLVGTGDARLATGPHDLSSPAGKLLRIDPLTGGPAAGNTWGDGAPPDIARVYGYGHHDVVGIALQPETDQVYVADPGLTRDDEVDHELQSGDHGFDPEGPDGGYEQDAPMTDLTRDGLVLPLWSSGNRAPGVAGLAFLQGEEWGGYDDLLVVALGEDTGLLALQVDRDEQGQLRRVFRVPELEDTHGRLRTPRAGADGVLYVLTDNGGGGDELLRVTPRG